MKYKPTELGTRLGENIRILREERDLTQQALAEAVSTELGEEIRPITILRIEKGKRATSVDELGALAAVFEVAPESLISLDAGATGERAALTSLVREANGCHARAMGAVANFEEAQEKLEAWCRDHRPEFDHAKGGNARGAERHGLTSGLERSRIKLLLGVSFQEQTRRIVF